MFDYYSSIILLSWMSLGVLSILVWENNRIRKSDKKIFYISYLLIALSALAELIGLKINGNMNVPKQVIILVKSMDYILTPLAGGAIVGQLRIKNKISKILYGILGLNTAFQIVSVFTGWMTSIDANHYYSHGPLYIFYMVEYFSILVIVIIQFVLYGLKFKKHNRFSLYGVLVLVIAGIGIQELLGADFRTAYITLSLSAILLFIHYSEYSQLRSDERIQAQSVLITTDSLTGAKSRYAYSQKLNEYNAMPKLPDDLTVFLVDINGLKRTNDTLGHDAGDELIRGSAECIEKVFDNYGSVYRIGGDEFVVFAKMNRAQAETMIPKLNEKAAAWKGREVKSISLSSGFAIASEFPELNCEQLAAKADEEMYKAKEEYYRVNGLKRRV